MSVSIMVKDSTGKHLWANDEAQRIHTRPIVGLRHKDFLDRETADDFGASDRAARTCGEPITVNGMARVGSGLMSYTAIKVPCPRDCVLVVVENRQASFSQREMALRRLNRYFRALPTDEVLLVCEQLALL